MLENLSLYLPDFNNNFLGFVCKGAPEPFSGFVKMKSSDRLSLVGFIHPCTRDLDLHSGLQLSRR